MALQAEDWERINGCLPRLYRELDSQKHLRVALEVLNELVPADSLAVNIAGVNMPNQLSAVSLPENHATPEQVALIGQYVHESPFTAYYLATLDGQWKMITDFVPLEDFHKTNLHRLALAPLGIQEQMCAAVGVLDGTGYWIVINRTRRGFTERERERLNAMQPHLVTSFINAAAYGRSQQSHRQVRAALEIAPGAYGYFDEQGKLVWLQEKAAAWLGDFFADEAKDAGNNLPQSIRRLVEESQKNDHLPQPLEKVAGEECLVVCLGASAAGGWVMRLERKPSELPPHFVPLPQLSGRQNDVLRWMVEGKRNTEIAVILGLSRRTVEHHVRAILEVLLVENRATAIVRAMEYCAARRQETLKPGATAP